jgi:hypothetical protein
VQRRRAALGLDRELRHERIAVALHLATVAPSAVMV